ncbi:MAG TPA: MaoC/PaaZ C-terminal domain-containing protein, partial [Candidatus Acidoferrum sp.]|nr:MaoC/PaaZ C-terminal domain-containing protein [Candidatus Acidoferrum sp.]
MKARYLEDYVPGSVEETRSAVVTADELRSFAERYDPQPIHIDEAAAKESPYGGLITSGWHTASLVMRLLVDELIDGRTSLGSPGVGPIRWLVPVRAGDTLRVR